MIRLLTGAGLFGSLEVLRSTDQSINRLPQLWDEVNLMTTTAISRKDASGRKGHGQVRYCGLFFVCC